MSDTDNSDKMVEDQENTLQEPAAQNATKTGPSDSKVDAIASVVIIACLVAIAATFISGGLA